MPAWGKLGQRSGTLTPTRSGQPRPAQDWHEGRWRRAWEFHPRPGPGLRGCVAAERMVPVRAQIRKLVVTVEEVRTEGRRPVDPPLRRAAAIAVIQNPYAGRYEEDLSPMFELGDELAALLAGRAVEALGIPGEQVSSYG